MQLYLLKLTSTTKKIIQIYDLDWQTAEILNFRKLNKLKIFKSAVYSGLYSGNLCSKQEMILIFCVEGALPQVSAWCIIVSSVWICECVCLHEERERVASGASVTDDVANCNILILTNCRSWYAVMFRCRLRHEYNMLLIKRTDNP